MSVSERPRASTSGFNRSDPEFRSKAGTVGWTETANMGRYLIGIDLGTTNSALAYVDLERTARNTPRVNIHPFAVPQLVAPGEVKERPLLPSFLYLPGEHDVAPGATALPWD